MMGRLMLSRLSPQVQARLEAAQTSAFLKAAAAHPQGEK